MTILTFQVEVNDDLGAKLGINSIERKKIDIMLKGLINNSEVSNQSFFKALNQLSEEAKANGLTDEKLEELINQTDND